MVISKLRKFAKAQRVKARDRLISNIKSDLYETLTDFQEHDIASGLIPIGDTGLYRTPDEPADPTDCARYPDSPFCGGNPFNEVFFDLSPTIINTDCDLGARLDLTLGYIKFPPVALVYRKPECRKRRFESAQPFKDEYPDGQEYEVENSAVFEARGLGNIELSETREVFEWALFYRIPGFYVKPGTNIIMTAWLIYYYDCRYNLHQWHNTYMLDRPHPTIPVAGEDDKSAYPLVQLDVYRNEDLYQSYEEYQAFLRERQQEFLGRDSLHWYKEGANVSLGKCFLKVQDKQHLEDPDLFRLPVHLIVPIDFSRDATCYKEFKAPPPPIEEECCMRCCKPYDDSLIKLLLKKVNTLSEIVGVTEYPLETEPSIANLAQGITELIERESTATDFTEVNEKLDNISTNVTELVEREPGTGDLTDLTEVHNKLDTISTNVTELVERDPGTGDPADLTEVHNKLDTISNVLGTESYPQTLPGTFIENPDPEAEPVADVSVATLTDLVKWYVDRYRETIGGLGIVTEIDLGLEERTQIVLSSLTDVYRQLLNRTDETNKPDSPIRTSLTELLQKLVKLSDIVGVDEYPASLPASFLSIAGLSLPNAQIPNLTRFLSWYVERFDEIMGQFEIPIQIKDADLTQEGDQTQEIKLPNVAESIAEIVGLQLQTSVNTELLVNLATRILIECGQDKQQNFKSAMLLDAIGDYLGFEQKETVQKMPLSFDPTETESFSKLLKEKELEINTIECADKTTFKANILDLLQAAAVIRAVFWRKIDPKADVAAQLKDIITKQHGFGKKINSDEDFDEFLEQAELGFTGESGTTIKKPYGRDLSERPRIKKVGKTNDSGT